jgi:5-methylcytosine-specific restriction endonuclease McrA
MKVLETGTCGHSLQEDRYQPSQSLRHLIQVRQPQCSFPGCRRPATATDLDHTIPYDQGGRTCSCNLASLCRRHHQAKQAPGWQLTQPTPGVMTWRTPSGRTYRRTPDAYPT